VTQPAHIAWSLRPISHSDLEWAYGLHKEAVGVYVAGTWGWDEAFQRQMFVDRFTLRREVIQVGREDVGVLIVDERPDELYLELVELTSSWQNRGLGTEILAMAPPPRRGVAAAADSRRAQSESARDPAV
jgi:hypothetical protein